MKEKREVMCVIQLQGTRYKATVWLCDAGAVKPVILKR